MIGGSWGLKGARCRVLGLGRSNEALISYLDKECAEIIVSDKRKSENEISDILQAKGIKKAQIIPYYETAKADYIFRTPSVRPDAPEISAAVSKGAKLTSEIELFFDVAKGKIYGITGSDGKTTTTTLAYEILKRTKGDNQVFVGGNIGIPPISFADKLTYDSITVLELSSFQLMTLQKSPVRSAITNITENHLDYHKDMEEYIRAKCRIASEDCETLVISDSAYEDFLSNARYLPGNLITTSYSANPDGIGVSDSYITYKGERILGINEILVPEKYNVANFMTAIGLTYQDTENKDILCVAKEFKGVEHRNEFVCQKNGVSYYNCSIDSTPSRTLATLSCHENESITLICGGYDKNLDYKEFAELASMRVKQFVLVGSNKNKIKAALEEHSVTKPNMYVCEDFKEAVLLSAEISKGSSSVLLSPASASFDMFKNFEERGICFKNIVNNL